MNIKNSIPAILLFIGFSFNLSFAQDMDAKVSFTKIVNKSADGIWEIIREMDNIDKYSSVIASVDWKGDKGVGGERVCHSPDGKGYFKERIAAFDDLNRSYSYSLIEGAPVMGMTNTMRVIDLGYNKCMVVWWSHYDSFVENPQMTEAQFQAFLKQSLEEMVSKIAAEA